MTPSDSSSGDDKDRDVLTSLPRTRPSRRSDKRPARSEAGTTTASDPASPARNTTSAGSGAPAPKKPAAARQAAAKKSTGKKAAATKKATAGKATAAKTTGAGKRAPAKKATAAKTTPAKSTASVGKARSVRRRAATAPTRTTDPAAEARRPRVTPDTPAPAPGVRRTTPATEPHRDEDLVTTAIGAAGEAVQIGTRIAGRVARGVLARLPRP